MSFVNKWCVNLALNICYCRANLFWTKCTIT